MKQICFIIIITYFLHLYVALVTKQVAKFKRILQGDLVMSSKEYPWQAQIIAVYKTERETVCTGSLIINNYVLTAAHCVFGAKVVHVTISDVKSTTGVIKYQNIRQWYAHQCFVKNPSQFQYDLALIKLNKIIEPTEYARPISLPIDNIDSYDNKNAIVLGWGATKPDEKIMSPYLLFAKFIIQKQAVCGPFYEGNPARFIIEHPDNFIICAHGVNQATCVGDGGGPLSVYDEEVQNHILVGVNSFGHPDGCERWEIPQGFVRVSEHLEWIDGVINADNDERIPPVGCNLVRFPAPLKKPLRGRVIAITEKSIIINSTATTSTSIGTSKSTITSGFSTGAATEILYQTIIITKSESVTDVENRIKHNITLVSGTSLSKSIFHIVFLLQLYNNVV